MYLMRASARRIGLAAVVLGLVVGTAERADAGSIIYTETSVGSGSLGTISFTNAPFTFTATADTGNITPQPGSILAVATASATVDVSGIGIATVIEPVVVFDQYAPPIGPTTAGFAVGTPGTFGTIMLLANSAFASYNLATSIGPLTGLPGFGMSVETSLGSFALNPFSATFPGTFQASSVVPEPSSFVGAGSGILLLLGYAWRKCRRAAA